MIGKTISHYKIIKKLGGGGMGIVYKAQDLKLDRFVALKFLPPELTRDEESKKRFIHEAKAASALEHTNICNIHEVDETEDGQIFIVMSSYEGETLKKKIEKSALKADDAIDIAMQIAEGLSRAHEKEIIHRDIKPANIFITNEGVVKILDFGLAKVLGQTQLTKMGSTVGTVSYMSPEQAMGETVDHRTDIWSLGVVLCEMLTGQLPFKGDYEQAILYSIINEEPIPLKKVNPSIEPELTRIVDKSLKKEPESRYSSVEDILNDFRSYQESLLARETETFNLRTFLRRIRQPRIAIPTVFLIIIFILAGVWFFNRQAKIRWAREEVLPEIEKLVEKSWRDFTDAYKLEVKAEKYIPNDPRLIELLTKSSLHINIKTEPAGVKIYMKEYSKPENEWQYLGVSPIDSIRVPIGIFRWKMEKEGYEIVLVAAATWNIDVVGKELLVPNNLFRVLDKKGNIPPGMVHVSGAQTPFGKLNDFYIDKYEVTNKAYKKFINNGGYRKKEYWEQEFIENGKVLPWVEAIAKFVDQTGRPGPATWMAGDYPEGQGNYPVSGISWYEAAAYAEFVGKSLPTGQHWGLARGEYTPLIRWPQLGGYAVFAPYSNFEGNGPVAVGSLPGITSYGAYDMAGNVREWCWNKTSSGRLVRGGAWNDNTYRFKELAQAPAFDRSSKNGFRCALYPDPEKIPESVFAMKTFGITMDFYKEKPVSDAIFQVYKEQFTYDKTALNARLESKDESSEDWVKERITFDAAYGGERIIANLFLPKNTAPPYQTIIYFPGDASRFQKSSKDIENYYEFPLFLSFLVKNGRAVLYPVYKGTFERRDATLARIHLGEKSHLWTEYMIQLVKDFKRSVDYLETRQDININKIAFYGPSWGGWLGAIIPAVEGRLEASILLAGGLLDLGRPEVHPINYVTRVKTPTLMLNGKYDTVFPYETSQKPMFNLLGTSDKDKELKLYETDHIPPKKEFIRETLAWLDRYLGSVK